MILFRAGWSNSTLTYEAEGMAVKVTPSPDGNLLKCVIDVSAVPAERLRFRTVQTLPCVLDMGTHLEMHLDNDASVIGFSVDIRDVGAKGDAFVDSVGRTWELRSGKRGGVSERIVGCLRLVAEEGFLLVEGADKPDSRVWKMIRES